MKIAYRFLLVILISMFLFGCGDKTAGIEGKIVDGKGQPVSGCSVMFKQVQPTQGYEQFETKTGPDGIFRLTGAAPLSDYVLTILSDKWKTNVTTTVKTLEKGENLVLSTPIKIRFNQMKDGTVVDTKTGLQWLIHPVADVTASNVMATVQGLQAGGFMDWRLPTREDISGLQAEKAPVATPSAETALVNKTCCAWVIDTTTSEVDWKFYVEEENELWSSSKDSPDNRIVVVRNFSAAPAVAAVAPTAAPTVAPGAVAQTAGDAAGTLVIKPTPPGIKFASRKACADKRSAAPAGQAVPEATSAATATAPVAPAPVTAKVAPAPAPVTAKVAPAPAPAKVAAAPAPAAPAPVTAKVAPPASSAGSISLYFDLSSKTLKPEEVAKLKEFISKNQGAKGTMVINGHSDAATGSSASNLILAMNRTSYVATLINNMGLSKNVKLELRASGDGKQIASNDTAEGQKQNRRVEVSFVAQ
ncbi:MAG: OmpA family protein [Smithellaceae bacterium]